MFSPHVEATSREELHKSQSERLIRTVDSVYKHVPFYRDKFVEAGVQPHDIQSISDITTLPFTNKQDLRDHYPFGLLAVPKQKLARIHASSGTSGKPTIVGYTKNDLTHWGEMTARAIVLAGGSENDLIHNAYGYGLFTGGLGLHGGIETLGAAAIPVSGGNTERQILLLQDLQPDGICATPSYMISLIEKMEQMGCSPASIGLKYGIFGAEPWSEEMRSKLEQKLGIKAIDIYGLSEVLGPGVSAECHEAQNGLHIAEDHFLVEVINPETLEPVEEGTFGELVFTSLTKEALPIIRYRTGDIAALTTAPCSCGRTTARMTRVKGRTDDMFIIRGVNVFPSEMERVLLEVEELVPHYQIHRLQQGSMEAARVHVEVCDHFYQQVNGDLLHEQVYMLKRTIAKQLKSACLISVEIVLEKPGGIPRSEGKAIRIIDHRHKQQKGVVK
ncbi:phenylacetate--CoA ligase family protein [Shouchella sp. JSM 1781072]|uniref:phenylacetate--CoA ligase family protein n=1 Tax=Bacillaceae TaxID=186817 RepID=UPI000C083277|nr:MULTISPECIES: AMP-binding protein [Bacillaceae]UTR07284.1 AMP-binding protein [Alkalihalobacillus sp. LMS6]